MTITATHTAKHIKVKMPSMCRFPVLRVLHKDLFHPYKTTIKKGPINRPILKQEINI